MTMRPPPILASRLRLKKCADRAIRMRCAQVANALHDRAIPSDRDTGIALVALGLQLLQEMGASNEMAAEFCQRVLDTPPEEDPRGHTGGT